MSKLQPLRGVDWPLGDQSTLFLNRVAKATLLKKFQRSHGRSIPPDRERAALGGDFPDLFLVAIVLGDEHHVAAGHDGIAVAKPLYAGGVQSGRRAAGRV